MGDVHILLHPGRTVNRETGEDGTLRRSAAAGVAGWKVLNIARRLC
jgi:hypothetical protein